MEVVGELRPIYKGEPLDFDVEIDFPNDAGVDFSTDPLTIFLVDARTGGRRGPRVVLRYTPGVSSDGAFDSGDGIQWVQFHKSGAWTAQCATSLVPGEDLLPAGTYWLYGYARDLDAGIAFPARSLTVIMPQDGKPLEVAG